jgi:hypothetical protein
MNIGLCKTAHAVMSLLLLSSSSGCSFIFVKTPPSDPPPRGGVTSRVAPADCTSSRLAPGFDTAFGALQMVRTGMAATASDSVYDNPNAPLSREADIALGASFMALFVGSAIYGFVNTSRCSRLQRGDDYDEPLASESRETWGASTQEARPARPAPPPAPPSEPEPEPEPEPAAAAENGLTPPGPTPDQAADPEQSPSHFESAP